MVYRSMADEMDMPSENIILVICCKSKVNKYLWGGGWTFIPVKHTGTMMPLDIVDVLRRLAHLNLHMKMQVKRESSIEYQE